jgi:hypothetical protein
MTFLNQKQSIIKLTEAMNGRDKFAYINIPKSSIVSLSRNSENSFPNFFAKNVISSLKVNDSRVMKAISHSLVPDIADNKHYKIGLHKNNEYLYSNVFEYYYMNERDNYNCMIDFYIRNTPSVIVTFHDKKLITKALGSSVHVISIPFNNYYSKIDDVYAQLAEFDGGSHYCLLDCGVFGLGIFPKVWKNLDMSIIDLGKTISLLKGSSVANHEKERLSSN